MLQKARLLGAAVRDGAIEERGSESVGNPRPDDASARPVEAGQCHPRRMLPARGHLTAPGANLLL